MARRKKKPVRPEREKITSYEGWNAGDCGWALLHPAGFIQIEIIEFHPKDNLGPAVTVRDVKRGQYRTVLFSGLTDKQPKRGRKKTP